ncbi:HAMP domain-containing sensor histidine kinase [Acrocarpospora sp. B8E8]|uniref:sensor histidine kinase n=1 Tax=Acrocarpospora sp. B8E8 TaxID=3153572 RepID=UPI00325F3CD0
MAWHDTQQQAILIAAAIRGGSLPHVVTPTVPGVDLVQVVAPDGRVLAGSPAARNKPPISVARPAPNDPLLDLQTCSNSEPGCLRYSALRVDARADSPIVLAARRTSTTLSTGFVDAIVAAQATVLVSCVAGLTWAVTGRILQPVDAIRSKLAKITFSDLSHRIAEPAGDDEICRLIRTLNQTLLRLETATHQQRRFVADASHELRTPVAGLRVKLEEAQMHPRDIDLNGLLEHADRCRPPAGDPGRHAHAGQSRIQRGAQTSAGRPGGPDACGTERRAHTPPIRSSLEDGVTVAGVPSQLSRMLTNLLDNAQRHARHVVDIEVHRDSDSALVTVCDDGPGIAEADRERIFERFTRLDTARSRGHGGTGLGLAIVSDVVHAHAGTILVGESVHGGSRFDVRFPLLTDAP